MKWLVLNEEVDIENDWLRSLTGETHELTDMPNMPDNIEWLLINGESVFDFEVMLRSRFSWYTDMVWIFGTLYELYRQTDKTDRHEHGGQLSGCKNIPVGLPMDHVICFILSLIVGGVNRLYTLCILMHLTSYHSRSFPQRTSFW